MSKVILFPQDDGVVSIVHPTPEAEKLIGIQHIALKDVPAGTPFCLVELTELPTFADKEARLAWRYDFTSPDGYGLGHDQWTENLNAGAYE